MPSHLPAFRHSPCHALSLDLRWTGAQIIVAAALLAGLPSQAQTQTQTQTQWSTDPALVAQAQVEADDRVIAARCGSPAFEKQFFRQSQAAVRAGLISDRTNPARVEQAITALRRNPTVLVTANVDCAAQLQRLRQVVKARSQSIGTARQRR
jgi:hypothetical protein